MDTVSDDGMLEDVPLFENEGAKEEIRGPQLSSKKNVKLMSMLTPVVSSPFSFRNRKKVVEIRSNDGAVVDSSAIEDLFVEDLSALENDSKGKSHEESRSTSGISHGTDSSDTISDGEEEEHVGEESPNVKRVARLPFFRPHLLFKAASERSRSRRSTAELNHDSAAPPSCEQATPEQRSRRRFVDLQTMTKDYSKWKRGTGAADATTINRSSLEEISFASGSLHGEDVEIIDLASGERVQKRTSSARRVVDDESPEQTRRRFVSLQNVSKGYPKWQRSARSKNGDEEPRFALEEISFANGSLHGEDSAIMDLAPLGERATPEQNNAEGVIDGLSQGSLSYLAVVP